jgi:hypothetical protein
MSMLKSLKVWWRLRLEDVQFRRREIVRRNLRKLVEIAITDLDLMGAIRDVGSSAAFERQHLQDAADFKGRHQLYRHVLSLVPHDEGLFLEFGVYKGDSINRLAALKPDVQWHGFDSFIGLPEAWTLGARKGAFDVAGQLPAVLENVALTKGFFEDTLPTFVAKHRNETVAFLHIDCDLYSATKTVLEQLSDMLTPGCVVVFDEYFKYSGWEDGEYKALMEYIATKGRTFEYVGYVRTGGQVAVRVTS